MIQFLVHHWGDLASVAGLVATAFAIGFARSARTAAQEARKSVQVYAVAEVLNEAVGRLHDLGNFMRSDQWDIAALRAEELITFCSTILKRQGERLDESASSSLILSREQLRIIYQTLVKASSTPPTERERSTLHDALQIANENISELRGTALSTYRSRRGLIWESQE